MELLEQIVTDLATYLGVKVRGEIVVTLKDDEYRVILDDLEEDEDDPIGDKPMVGTYKRPRRITDHVTLLDAILHAISRPPYRKRITGLTTDGDHNDCEAIFSYNGNPTVLKVRS